MVEFSYPDVDWFSKSIGIPAENLIEAFKIEKIFHKKILEEESFEKRQEMYHDVYNTVHPIYGKNKTNIQQNNNNPKDKTVRLFRKELEGKSILDVGCGEGYFLESITKKINHKKLVGIDVSIPPLSKHHPDIKFISANIVRFNINDQFDVVFSDQVLEHIAPDDLIYHLSSINSALKSNGLFIIIMPNRLFGPSDVTRIIDFSYTGKTNAQGTHLNESTYGELIPLLKQHGFQNFRTVLPLSMLKYRLNTYRIRPTFLLGIEKSAFILKFFRTIKRHGQPFFRFDTTLICSKS